MMIPNVTSQPKTSLDPSTRAKLTDAAQQFEGMFLQEMLKPLRTGSEDGSLGDDSDSGGDADTINNFGVEAVAKAISQSGGLGIARQVIQQVTAEHEKSHPGVNSK